MAKNKDPIATALSYIIGIYVIFQVVKVLIQNDPLFEGIALKLLGAIVIGAVWFFRNKLFK